MEKLASEFREIPPDVRVSEFSSVDARFAVLSVATPPPEHLPALTVAERDVVSLILRGASNRQIAEHRRTSERTVANQIAAIFQKLQVGSRAELVLRVQSTK